MKTILAALASTLFFAASACSATQIHTGALDTAPYAQFHTFAFAPMNGGVTGYRATTRAARVVDMMKPAIGGADLVIVCSAGRRDAEQSVKVPWRMTAITGEEFEDHDFVEGGLVIDVFDKSGGQSGTAPDRRRSIRKNQRRTRSHDGLQDHERIPFPCEGSRAQKSVVDGARHTK